MPIRPIALVVALTAVLGTTPWPAAAQAPTPAGRVKVSSGTATIVRGGQMLPAPVGAEVFESDVMRTGADGRLAVMLRDETRVALGPGSEVALAAFAYAPSESTLAVTLRLVRGVDLVYLGTGGEAVARGRDHPDTDGDHRRPRHPRARPRGRAVTAATRRRGGCALLLAGPRRRVRPAPPGNAGAAAA